MHHSNNSVPKIRVSFYLAMGLVGFLIGLCLTKSWTSIAHPLQATPGPYLALAVKARPSPSFTPTPSATPTYGILLISEVMVRPEGDEPEGEWVELYNAGGATINLALYKLGDEETKGQGEGMLQFPTGASLAPGQAIVVANKAAVFQSIYGIAPDYEMTASSGAVPDMRKYRSWATGSVNLVNSGDEVLVLDAANAVVDAVSWGDSSWIFYPSCETPATGWSLERYPAYLDTDTARDWRNQFAPGPGEVDLTPPTSTPTLTPTQTHLPTPSSSATASSTSTGTLSFPNPSHTPTHTLTPLLSGTFTHTPTPTRTDPAQPSLTPTASGTATNTPQPTLAGDRLLISEVLYDPVGTEPDHEWIELYNAGDTPINLSGYKVGDEELRGDTEGMYKFPAGSSITAGQVIIIANRADVFTDTYGFYPDYELVESVPEVPTMLVYLQWSPGVVNLNNVGDEVFVLDGGDQIVDAVSWGTSSWAFDPPCPDVTEGHSLERAPADIDTDTAADWIDQTDPNPGTVTLINSVFFIKNLRSKKKSDTI